MANSDPSSPWMYAGITSSFPNIDPSSTDASGTDRKTRLCRPLPDPWDEPSPEDDLPQLCKIFQASMTAGKGSLEELPLDKALPSSILVFRYRNKIHAIDHACPHQSYPLTRGTISDIEDFGIVLSAAITCPKHGWTFDLHTGQADRGRYQLGLYEVELRPGQSGDEEVWIRKKERKRIG